MRSPLFGFGLVLMSAIFSFAVPVIAEDDEEIELADVPQKVKDAAIAAVKGIKLTEASIEKEDGKTVYELEGTVDGKEYEIEVDEDGKVLEVEQEDDDDDDNDDN